MNTASTNLNTSAQAGLHNSARLSPDLASKPQAWRQDAADGIEARFGLRVTALLNERAEAAPHDIAERLRVAREQAVERARSVRKAEAAVTAGNTSVVGRSGNAALLGGQGGSWWMRLASVLPLVLLVAGLVAIDDVHDNAQVTAAADFDSALLSDDLPPDAYSDPGFIEYLKTQQE